MQTLAAQNYSNDLIHCLRERFQIKPLIENVITADWYQGSTGFELLPLENVYRGAVVDLRGSDNLEFYGDYAELYVGNAPVNVEIFVWDVHTGQLLTQPGEIVQQISQNGFIRVPIEKRFRGRRLFIAYDGSVIQSIRTTYRGFEYYKGLCQQTCACTVSKADCATLEIGNLPIEVNLDYESECGMILSFSCCCSLENFICKNHDKFIQPFYYLLGLELLTAILGSDRINKTTLMSAEKFGAVMDYCQSHYKKALENICETIEINDPVCAPCKAKFKKTGLVN